MIANTMGKFLAILTVGLFTLALGACDGGSPADQAGEAAEETTTN